MNDRWVSYCYAVGRELKGAIEMKSGILAVITLIVSGSLLAQSAAVSQITGTVRDSTGSVVAGANVTVTQTDTGFVRTGETEADGAYRLPSLPIGPYRLEAKKVGFSTFVQSGIVLQVNTNPTIDITLKLGSVTESITVEAGAAMVEANTSGIGQVVDQRRVAELPLNGRVATELVMLTGAAVPVPIANSGQLISQKNYPNAIAISVGGSPANGLTYTLDGASHNDPVNNAGLPLPFPDALQEFKVETSALLAQYGQHAGGAINAVTKSGSNAFHGNAFEFLRNRALTTRNFFAAQPDTLRRHQFGGTFGGPIVRNKLFFFGGYQQTKQSSDASKNTAFLPTPDMLRGDFRTITSTACRAVALNLPAPFVGNQVPTSLFNPAALKMMSIYNVPVNECGQTSFTTLNNFSEYSGVTKVDWQINGKHTVFIRYLAAHSLSPISYSGNPLSIIDASPDNLVNSVTIGETWVPNGSTVNSFRANFNRAAINKTQVTKLTAADLGIPLAPPPTPNNLNVIVTGAFNSVGQNSFGAAVPTQSFQFADDVSIQRSNHQLQFGANWIHEVQNAYFVGTNAGSFTFSGQFTGNFPMADFLLGKASAFSQSSGTLDSERVPYYGFYGQDNWRINSRLTLNYGLRWEPYLGPQLKYDHVTHFERSLYDAGVRSSIYPNAPAGVQYPGDPGFDTNGRPSHIYWPNFAPRIGLAYDPMGDGKMSIRASWGILNDVPHTLFFDAYGGTAPWGLGVTNPNTPVKFDDPWAGYPGGNPFPVKSSKDAVFPSNLGFLTVPLNLRPTYLQQWNLTVQRQFGANWLASVSYLGNHTTHMWASKSLNPSVYLPADSCVLGGVTYTPCSTLSNNAQRRVLTLVNPTQGPSISGVTTLDDGANASYNAFLASVNHRFARNFTVLANYTWSHCIADPVSLAIGGSYVRPDNRAFDRGNCGGIDIRHIVNASAVLQSPNFSGRLLHAVGSGWQLSPILSFRSGTPITVTSGVDSALTGVGGQRPNQVLDDVYCVQRSPSCWLNPKAFTVPTTGTYGNLGAYNIYGPNYFSVNVSVSRRFAIFENHAFEIRGEAFNVQNRVNFNVPTTALNSANFGKITSDVNSAGSANGSPRIIQLSAKYSF